MIKLEKKKQFACTVATELSRNTFLTTIKLKIEEKESILRWTTAHAFRQVGAAHDLNKMINILLLVRSEHFATIHNHVYFCSAREHEW